MPPAAKTGSAIPQAPQTNISPAGKPGPVVWTYSPWPEQFHISLELAAPICYPPPTKARRSAPNELVFPGES